MNILIVDDHGVIHRGLTRILDDEFAGSSFGEARDSQSALDLLSREPWDVVILDIDLPGRGGLDLLKVIRAERPKLPIIMFSMHSEEQFAVRSLKAGASGYVAKTALRNYWWKRFGRWSGEEGTSVRHLRRNWHPTFTAIHLGRRTRRCRIGSLKYCA